MDAIPIWHQETTTKTMTRELAIAARDGNCEAVRDSLVSGECHIDSVRYISPYSTFSPMSLNDALSNLQSYAPIVDVFVVVN